VRGGGGGPPAGGGAPCGAWATVVTAKAAAVSKAAKLKNEDGEDGLKAGSLLGGFEYLC